MCEGFIACSLAILPPGRRGFPAGRQGFLVMAWRTGPQIPKESFGRGERKKRENLFSVDVYISALRVCSFLCGFFWRKQQARLGEKEAGKEGLWMVVEKEGEMRPVAFCWGGGKWRLFCFVAKRKESWRKMAGSVVTFFPIFVSLSRNSKTTGSLS